MGCKSNINTPNTALMALYHVMNPWSGRQDQV